MKISDLKTRVDTLIQLADNAVEALKTGASGHVELLHQFRSGGFSFLKSAFGKEHTFYEAFQSRVYKPEDHIVSTKEAKGVLMAAKEEIDNGWLFELKTIVSAEIFDDFFEMANYLLSGGFKDAAAVMIGGILEGHLRQLCSKNGIHLTYVNPKGETKNKMADQMNNELYAAKVYNLTDQKQVVAWLDIRNKSAHGEYGAYTKEQVVNMLAGVINFTTRIV